MKMMRSGTLLIALVTLVLMGVAVALVEVAPATFWQSGIERFMGIAFLLTALTYLLVANRRAKSGQTRQGRNQRYWSLISGGLLLVASFGWFFFFLNSCPILVKPVLWPG
ncbi:MAG: hypothetical protein KGO02_01235 [Alphaproteobacteria bacterium]|nr:hypothetical protein [Alphaproteobacteria bacterium]